MASGASALAVVSNVRSWSVTEKLMKNTLNVMPAYLSDVHSVLLGGLRMCMYCQTDQSSVQSKMRLALA